MSGVCSQRWRETGEEQRELERLNFDIINEVRHAAEVHRQVPPQGPGHPLSVTQLSGHVEFSTLYITVSQQQSAICQRAHVGASRGSSALCCLLAVLYNCACQDWGPEPYT